MNAFIGEDKWLECYNAYWVYAVKNLAQTLALCLGLQGEVLKKAGLKYVAVFHPKKVR